MATLYQFYKGGGGAPEMSFSSGLILTVFSHAKTVKEVATYTLFPPSNNLMI